MSTGVFYHQGFLKHDAGFAHPERPERLTATLDFLNAQNAFDDSHLRLLKPRAATLDELEQVHPKEYIELIRLASDRETRFDSDTRASKGSYNAALLAAGAGLRAWEAINNGELQNAFCLVRPPGHHANANAARGFCLFNNVSVLARHITTTNPKSRVLILDIDAHHGNGTQEIHYQESDIFYLGLHQDGRTLYPGYSGYSNELGEEDGLGYNVNLPLPPGTADQSFLRGLEMLFPALADQYKPTAILVSAGYDAHYRDFQTGMDLSNNAYYQAAKLVMKVANKICNGRVIMFLEGGYDLRALSESIYNTLVAMSGKGTPVSDTPPKEDPRVEKYLTTLLNATKSLLKPWWKIS